MCCSAAVPPAPGREQDSLLSLSDSMEPPPPGGNARCGYLAAFVTAGNPWFGEPNSSMDPSTAEECINVKLNSCSYYIV